MDIFKSDNTKLLMDALLTLKDAEQCRHFLEDLMTSKEIISLGQCLAVAKMLCENSKYSEVAGQTEASSATIGRVSRCIQYGNGGHRSVLQDLGCIAQEGR